MKAYIRNTGNISPQHTTDPDQFLNTIAEYESTSISCIEPDYKEFLNPIMARRMGRIIKMGVAAAKLCLRNTGVEVPDAIITGTGLGCIEDTEKFLISILENDEKLLPPTSFIQSTHNTVSAQIALELKCNSYNYTYVHRALSFESALLDALMMLAEGEAKSILLGAADEITANSLAITSRFGMWKQKAISNLNLYKSPGKGSIAGEGAAFFLLSDEYRHGDLARITAVAPLFDHDNSLDINFEISQFLNQNLLTPEQIDLVIYGYNGDIRYEKVYDHVRNGSLHDVPSAYYKHLCGEYFTSSSFAMWLAAKIISTQSVPQTVMLESKPPATIKNILIYNHYQNINHSLILLSKC